MFTSSSGVSRLVTKHSHVLRSETYDQQQDPLPCRHHLSHRSCGESVARGRWKTSALSEHEAHEREKSQGCDHAKAILWRHLEGNVSIADVAEASNLCRGYSIPVVSQTSATSRVCFPVLLERLPEVGAATPDVFSQKRSFRVPDRPGSIQNYYQAFFGSLGTGFLWNTGQGLFALLLNASINT
ncbi:hypothetical protein GGQ73_004625 [Rhizobium skierniewicense]|uniref:Uncharacterized protein n=1 Tax=Rhizobium skierniewicense TaxID=984260 RepID=A0A7W6G486_9HYPH|nr:hypothetical protein [Rhizobium skierniewicense]